jgi:hypothetical protein
LLQALSFAKLRQHSSTPNRDENGLQCTFAHCTFIARFMKKFASEVVPTVNIE